MSVPMLLAYGVNYMKNLISGKSIRLSTFAKTHFAAISWAPSGRQIRFPDVIFFQEPDSLKKHVKMTTKN